MIRWSGQLVQRMSGTKHKVQLAIAWDFFQKVCIGLAGADIGAKLQQLQIFMI